MSLTVLVPLAMRERMRRIDERIRCVGAAIEFFEQDQPKMTRRNARAWVAEWARAAADTRERVVKQWQRGELTTGQAILAFDEELRRLAPPRMWTITGR